MPPPHPTLAPARLPVPEGSTVLLSLPQPRVAFSSCSLALTVFCLGPTWKKTSSPCPEECLRAGASAPSPCPARPLSWRVGRSSVTRLLFLSLCPLSLPCVRPQGRLREEPPHFSRLRESARQPLHGIGTRRLFRGRKHLLQAGLSLLATPRHRSPARLTAQLSRGVRPEDMPRALPAAHGVPGSDAALLSRNPRAELGQSGGGGGRSEWAPAGDGFQSGCRRGRVRTECRSGSPGESAQGAPCSSLQLGVAGGWQL